MPGATIALRGMAWDHPRARDPLAAISTAWTAATGVPVSWDARPLKDFEDQPLEELATNYDLVLIDYPFMGVAAASGLIVPVNDWVDAAYLADQAAHSVGPSFASYTWAGKQWALAIDAACQVSAVREDLWRAAGRGELPRSWNQVAMLAADCRHAPGRIAIPLNPNHAYCAFLSVGVAIAGAGFWRQGAPVDQSAGAEALVFLRRLARDLHPASTSSDPIGISDLMAGTDEVLYVPLMFGYSNYARPGFRAKALRFGNAPRDRSGAIGSVLGGVGMALSSRSGNRDAAAALAREIGSAAVQCGIYARAGGQPGHGAAWESAEVNALTGGFFRSTRATMNQAFMRPRVTGHRAFQPLAGELIHACLWTDRLSAHDCLAEFGRLVDSLLPDWGRAQPGAPGLMQSQRN
jgi:multiple sugar transport system substrate-binding protein